MPEERRADDPDIARVVEELRQSEQRYRLLADHVHDVIWTFDVATMRITYVSPSVVRLRGLTVEQALAERLEQSVTPESLARIMELLDRARDDREDSYTGIFDQPCRDGSIKHVEVTVNLVRDESGALVQVVGVSRDATERVRTERALRESEARFRVLIEESMDMMQLLDGEGRYTFWSPAATAGLGWTSEEMLGKRGIDFVHPDDRAAAGKALRALLATEGASNEVTVRFRHKDGSWHVLESIGRNLLPDPHVRAVVGHTRDITAQHRLEAQFLQAQKLESVGRLAGGVAHDFNNLLTVITSCSDSLKQDVDAGAPPSPEDIEQIRAAAARARELTRQLLAFARKQVSEPVALDLNDVVRGSEKLLRRLLGEDVELVVALQPGLWTVHADPGQIEQVILNLAVNSRDAMPNGGTLTIQTRNETVTHAGESNEPTPGEWVRLVVRDSGVGMVPEVRSHLFEPFFTTKPVGKGTGLGLATVYGIVTQSGGHVSVESEPDRGSTFVVSLPRSHRLPVTAEAAPDAARGGGSETILVVEDDALVRSVTERILRRAGYRVLSAASGAEALAVVAGHDGPLDLLVTDVIMPGMNGRALVEELRRGLPRLRVLYVSGYTDDVISDPDELDTGASFLPKPFTNATLLARVRAMLDGI